MKFEGRLVREIECHGRALVLYAFDSSLLSVTMCCVDEPYMANLITINFSVLSGKGVVLPLVVVCGLVTLELIGVCRG